MTKEGVRGQRLPAGRAARTLVLALAISLAPATGLSPQAASIARAAEGKPVDKSRARYASGTAFFRSEKYAQALREFELGYLDRQDPAFLFNIAQCHRELQHPTEAVRFYRRFLSEAPEDHPSRGQAEQAVRELEGAAPSPSVPTPEWQVAPPPARAAAAPEPQGVVVPLPSAAPAAPPPPPAAVPAPAPAPATVAAAPAPEAEPSSPSTPAYKTWWFWTLIGAGVVGGILIGVAATSGNTPLCPTGRMCL